MNKHTRIWSLQEAKAKFSEVVKRAQTEGPQTVTVHGKPAVEIAAIGGERSAIDETGAGLVKILEKSPLREFGDNAFKRTKMKVTSRRIDL